MAGWSIAFNRLPGQHRVWPGVSAPVSGEMGTVDATDCVDAALHLAATGRADPRRMAIWDASAGGYTVLRALATTDVFAARMVRSAVVDLATWIAAAPKFQAHHAELLRSEQPPEAGKAGIRHPLLLIHGDEDRVTPIDQIQDLAQRLDRPLLVILGAGHTLRKSSDVRDVLPLEVEYLQSTAFDGDSSTDAVLDRNLSPRAPRSR